MKVIVTGLAALLLGLGSVAYAAGDYFPPERIHCSRTNDAAKPVCTEFNRQYLTEDVATNIEVGKDEVFSFASGSAYYTPDNAVAVFFTYKNPHFKTVKLKTVNASIKPDLANGSWRKISGDLYICDAGYMHCPINNLPAKA